MHPTRRRRPRVARFSLALMVGLGGLALVVPAAQASGSTPTPPPSVSQAQAAVNQAQAAAAQASTQLGATEQLLAAAQARANQLTAEVTSLNATIASDTTRYQQLEAKITADQRELSAYLRSRYEDGTEQNMLYIMSSGSFTQGIQRAVAVSHVGQAGDLLVTALDGERKQAAATLADDNAKKAQLTVAQQQAQAAMAVVQIEEENNAQLLAQDNQTVSADQQTLNTSIQYQKQQQAAAAAAAALAAKQAAEEAAAAAAQAKAQQQGTVFQPVPGATFSVNTNLTQPSGLTAASINQFLAGTGLAGLGSAYIQAEQTYHVNAQYLVAHSILESAWGTSALAVNKHNLFGYGANDANPYGDAMTFSSDQACIMYVAQKVATNYLSPTGRYYHGPTLLGMNVDYASDPLWAEKIATIADTIPVPGQAPPSGGSSSGS